METLSVVCGLVVVYNLVKLARRKCLSRKFGPKDTVLITGGAQGIGFEIAKAYSELGCKVVIWDIDSKQLSKAKLTLPNSLAFVCDITCTQSIESAVKKTLESTDCISLLVNNAAIANHKSAQQLTNCELEKLFQTNLFGHVKVTKELMPHIKYLAVVSSVLSFHSVAYEADYCSSKSALSSYFSTLRQELKIAKSSPRVTLVYPYHTSTRLFSKVDTGIWKYLFKTLNPKDVANALVKAVSEGQEEVFVPKYSKFVMFSLFFLPSWLKDWVIITVFGQRLKTSI